MVEFNFIFLFVETIQFKKFGEILSKYDFKLNPKTLLLKQISNNLFCLLVCFAFGIF